MSKQTFPKQDAVRRKAPAAWMLALLIAAVTAQNPSVAADTAPMAKPHQPVEIDRIVAIVNDDVITQQELNDRVRLISQQLQQQGTPPPPRNILEKQVLERTINDRVQLQFAKQTGIRVDDTQLDRTLQRIAENNKLSLPEFRAALAKDGINFSQFREDIRNEIMLAHLRERDVDNRVVVTDNELDNYLSAQASVPGREDEYELAQIIVQIPEQASPEQIEAKRTRAEQALQELNHGENFAQVAAAYSDAADAMQGGKLAWKTGGQLPTLYLEAVRNMKPGEISSILRSPNGFHILKLLDKRGKDAPMVVEQTHARHILVKTNELVSDTDAKNRLLQLKERIENGANFAELARLNSQDASAQKGGDLGWLSPGDTVPEFEHAMDSLKPGQISEPVRSPFGWHLIQVLERRKQDVTQERQRLLARQAIRQRKADEAYQDFVRQLRDQAFIEYRQEEK
jgi:peptidyl-prolyl cis-trans isomerase SurA